MDGKPGFSAPARTSGLRWFQGSRIMGTADHGFVRFCQGSRRTQRAEQDFGGAMERHFCEAARP